jgi:hypothetical protein
MFAAVVVVVLVSAAVLLPAALLVRRRRSAVSSGAAGLGLHPREVRDIEKLLRAAAVDETALLHRGVANYVGGTTVGYVVQIVDSRSGLALHLSDGRRLALGGVAVRSRRLVAARAQVDLLKPTAIERDGLSYRLEFAGAHGAGLEFYARQVALEAMSI